MKNLPAKLMFQIGFLKLRNPMTHFDFFQIFSENIRGRVVQAADLHRLLSKDHLLGMIFLTYILLPVEEIICSK